MPRRKSRKQLEIAMIEATAATQIRVQKDPQTIKAYAQDIEDGAEFPPIAVYNEDGTERYILADGFHRIHAFVDAGKEDIPVEVFEGGMHEALIHALGANHDHGLRLTNADKRNAVKVALKDPEISQLSLREIADICRVSHMTVARIRNEQSIPEPEPDDHNPEGEAPTDADESDKHVQREATQEEVDGRELLEACALVKRLPYPGTDIIERVAITKDLIADLEYVSTWCTDAVIEYRKAVKAGYEANN